LSLNHLPNDSVANGLREAKRLVVLVAGVTVVLLGIVMLVLPGPGLLTITIGLAVLASEFVWARSLLKRLKREGRKIGNSILGRSNGNP
jgi:uncharacterized protein (TIGR02611 family)